MTPEGTEKIEKETRKQSDSTLWHFHRRSRITASKCHRVAVMKSTTSPTKVIQELLYSQVKPTRQMREGLAKKQESMAQYIKKKQAKSGHEGLTVSKIELVICRTEGYLGASPDGLVHDPSVADPKGLLEMKYIQTDNNETLEDALVHKRICVKTSNGVTMNQHHQYYYQVQQSMYVTETSWIDFVVKGTQCSEIYIERVKHDGIWWEGVKKKLEFFFDSYICPELAYPRIKHGLQRLELTKRTN